MASNNSEKFKIGMLSVPMQIQNSIRNHLIDFAMLDEISFIELKKPKPDFSKLDLILVGWNLKEQSLIDNINKIRSIWRNRSVLMAGVGNFSESEKSIAFELGVGEWIDPNTIARDKNALRTLLKEHRDNLEVYKGLESKAEKALKENNSDDYQALIDSLIFLDGRNRIFIEFLGDTLLKNKKLEEALALYERVLINQPDAIRILCRAAEVSIKLGQYEKGKEFFKRADEAGKGFQEAILLGPGKKGIKGGPETLGKTLIELDSPYKVRETLESRVIAISETEGDDEAEMFLLDYQKKTSIQSIKNINYGDILKKKEKTEGGALYFEKKKFTAKEGGTLDYTSISGKKKRKF